MERPRLRWTLESINHDVFHEICKAILDTTCSYGQKKDINGHQSIKSLSTTNHEMRKRLEPIVFRSIYIDHKSWYITLDALEFIARCESVHNHMKRLHLRIRDAAPGSLESVDGLPQAFATVLAIAPKLEAISISVPAAEVSSHQAAVQKSIVILPSVRTLELGLHMEWMIELCPYVNTIKTHPYWPMTRISWDERIPPLVEFAGRARNVLSFEMYEHWTAELIENVYGSMPNLQNLGLLGRRQRFELKEILSLLGSFQNLKTLCMPSASELGMGFEPPFCGNAYMGPNGAEVKWRVQEERRQTEQKAACMIFSVCPRLEVLWIGRTKKCRPLQDDIAAVDESTSLNV